VPQQRHPLRLLAVPNRFAHPTGQGMLSGNYTAPMSIPDVGKAYTLTGTGVVAGLGKVNVSGSLYALGFIPRGTPPAPLPCQIPTAR